MSNKTDTSQQIPLPFGTFERFNFDLFLPEKNQQVVQQLKSMARGEDSKNIYLWGQSGTGKSHLLQAVCTTASNSGIKAAYIPFNQIEELSSGLLQGLEQLDIVCLDDLDNIVGDNEWETVLFHLFNRLRDNNCPMAFAAKQSPQGIQIALPDLKSRFAWDLTFRLLLLNNESITLALKKRAQSRMFNLPDNVLNYLVKLVSRDTHTLFGLLNKLDDATLASKKKLTIPFVKELLNLDN